MLDAFLGQGNVALMRSRLVEPLRLGDSKVDAELYGAATRLLILALTYYPSLVDLLLFPSGLDNTAPNAVGHSLTNAFPPFSHAHA